VVMSLVIVTTGGGSLSLIKWSIIRMMSANEI